MIKKEYQKQKYNHMRRFLKRESLQKPLLLIYFQIMHNKNSI